MAELLMWRIFAQDNLTQDDKEMVGWTTSLPTIQLILEFKTLDLEIRPKLKLWILKVLLIYDDVYHHVQREFDSVLPQKAHHFG